MKYLILGALKDGFPRLWHHLDLRVTGQTNLELIRQAVESGQVSQTPFLFGVVLILIALAFKIAAAPFQLWVPDVYQGAPTPITALLSVGSKAAGFIVLLRVLQPFLAAPEVSGENPQRPGHPCRGHAALRQPCCAPAG